MASTAGRNMGDMAAAMEGLADASSTPVIDSEMRHSQGDIRVEGEILSFFDPDDPEAYVDRYIARINQLGKNP